MTPLLVRLLLVLGIFLSLTVRPAMALEEGYRLAFGDSLAISASMQTAMFTEQAPLTQFGREFPLRPDGRVTLPLIGEVSVSGMTVKAVIALLEERYKPFLGPARFVVNVVKFRPVSLIVLGEVNRPGRVELKSSATLLGAIAEAGGLTEWAATSHVTVLRRGAVLQVVDLEQLLQGRVADVSLEDQDVIRIERAWYKPVVQNLPLITSFVFSLATLVIVLGRSN